MTDIKAFSLPQRRQLLNGILTQLDREDLKLEAASSKPQLKDLNHILLAYFSDPDLFNENLDAIDSVYLKIEKILESQDSSKMGVDSLKVCQILVFNLALHG